MHKEKRPYNETSTDNSGEKNANANFSGDVDQTYLPKMRTNYSPSDESVESATGVDFPINMPNPAVDPIVANNISTAEFDYT